MTDELQQIPDQPEGEQTMDPNMEASADERIGEPEPAPEGDLEQSEESAQGEDSADEAETSDE